MILHTFHHNRVSVVFQQILCHGGGQIITQEPDFRQMGPHFEMGSAKGFFAAVKVFLLNC